LRWVAAAACERPRSGQAQMRKKRLWEDRRIASDRGQYTGVAIMAAPRFNQLGLSLFWSDGGRQTSTACQTRPRGSQMMLPSCVLVLFQSCLPYCLSTTEN